jgi:hypothetical protein
VAVVVAVVVLLLVLRSRSFEAKAATFGRKIKTFKRSLRFLYLALEMEVASLSETLVTIYQTKCPVS